MNIFKSFLVTILVFASMTMCSCKDDKKIAETTTETQAKEYTAAYVCPMHCKDSGRDEAGKCDTCGMTLVNNEDHSENGHTHE